MCQQQQGAALEYDFDQHLNNRELEAVDSLLRGSYKVGPRGVLWLGKYNESDIIGEVFFIKSQQKAMKAPSRRHQKIQCSYSSCSGKRMAQIANRSHILVNGKGVIWVNSNITLNSVLHVPNMSYNLLSISKLTKCQNCLVTFYLNYCVFQDLTIGKTIGSVEEKEGLYFLDSKGEKTSSPSSQGQSQQRERGLVMSLKIGHPSFFALRVLYPNLFKNLDVSVIRCKPCELAKSHCVPYYSH